MPARPPRPVGPKPHQSGVWKKKNTPNDPDVNVAAFTYQNADIAQHIIVKAWTTPAFKASLLNGSIPNRVTAAVDALKNLPNQPVSLKSAIVLSEDEYHDGWDQDDDDQVVFVLPNATRAPGNTLETAKMLMASTPNGI